MPKVVFAADDSTHGTELWVTDGTAAGTYLLRDIYPGRYTGLGTNSNNPNNIVGLGNGKALFVATTGTVITGVGTHSSVLPYGFELWVTNGTPGTPTVSYHPNRTNSGDAYTNGTSMVKDAVYGPGSSNPDFITALGNGKALFSATGELWVSDGTYAGTSAIKSINPSFGSSSVKDPITALGNGKALFCANDGTHGYELWVSDGTSTGTSLVQDINPGSGSSGL
jgi:ELWxxDGT repeat protein